MEARELRASLRDFTRAAGGGLIIGLPLLYTMEIWFGGFLLPAWKILLLFGLAFAIVLGYNSIAGFRRERSAAQLLLDSVSTMGLGIAIAFVALLVLGRIDHTTSLAEAAGKIGLEAIPVAFGASVAATQLGGEEIEHGGGVGPLERLIVGAGGALLFAMNVAPTEEIVLLGIGASPAELLVVVATTLLVTLGLVFYADFGGRSHVLGGDVLERPWSETLTSYAVSLGVALLLLWAFGRTDGLAAGPLVGMIVMLGAVASVGAAIARMLVSGEGERGSRKGGT
ncbi:MAG TPA: DUF2391 family protein [Candidatus Limnocylindria bacterium]|jgi:putative integral membrane protein (TIGR02587 family)|nr:DUF2391 family protein [Candidatus Limnocylindria bacterium]